MRLCAAAFGGRCLLDVGSGDESQVIGDRLAKEPKRAVRQRAEEFLGLVAALVRQREANIKREIVKVGA